MQLLIDFNHLSYRNFFVARKDIEDVGWNYFKHLMIQSIFHLCRKFEPTEVVIAADSKQNWRRKIYPDYKANRKEKRDEQDHIDWDGLYSTMDDLFKDLRCYFPFYVLKVNYMEADDIIGAIAKQDQGEKKIIVTSDTDFKQLLKYNNVSVFDPIKGVYLESEDPEKELKVKIICGDSGDNIPNIIRRKMGDESVTKRLGEKTAQKMVESPELLKELYNDTTPILENDKPVMITENGCDFQLTIGKQAKLGFKRNTILIDLQYTPAKLIETLNQTLEDYIMADGKQIFQYVSENKFREFVNKISDYEPIIKTLVDSYNQKKVLNG